MRRLADGYDAATEPIAMCGIVGALVLGDSQFRVTEPYLVRMRDCMAHRGPDGAGSWIGDDGRIGLAHRRLAIIDLSDAAAQPMSNHDGSLWISFNGEIYNHAEIRAELERTGGYRWKTDHSDTEVILHAFEQWGIDCIQRFRGMFSIALWDTRKHELWLIRDRIGIKPLYYSVHHGRLTFASEIKALLADPDQKRGVHPEALYHYLSFLATPAPQTMFDGIKKLPGGTWLKVREDGSMIEQRYWDVWDHTTPLVGVSEDEIAERILAELRTAVKLRKVSDVPVGVFLSGGIDSSTNAALFSEGESRPVKTFTIGYDADYGSYRNELKYARTMAEKVGSDHHELLLSVDHLIAFLPRMVQLQDEPIGDPVCAPVYYVSKLARDNGVTVCQLGEGADELFWGYLGWKRMLQLQRTNELPVPAQLKYLGLSALRLAGRGESPYAEWLRRGAAGLPVFWGGAEVFPEARKQRLLSSALRAQLADLSSWDALQPIRRRFVSAAWEPSALHWMTYVDLNVRLPELLLMRVDKMSMGVGLEARVPFLDHKLVELAMSVPESVKTRHGTLKHILKKSVRGLIPDELIDRKKQGFGVPLNDWLLTDLRESVRTDVTTFCDQSGLLDRRAVADVLASPPGEQLWCLFNLALWWNEYIRCPRC
jgi:asparagine synthase (glutamine-hydrolysing)